MEVPLDGAHRASQGLGQGIHLGPAQAALVVSVVGEGTICRDRLGWDSSVSEVLDLRNTGKLGLLSHRRLLFLVRRCALMIEFIKAAGTSAKRNSPRRFFYALFTGAYFTYTGILALALEPPPPPLPALRLQLY